MILITQKSDLLGTFANSLCLVHCIATPFLFLAQAGAATCCDGPPMWWKFLDYLFLTISFLAVLWSTQNTTLKWTKLMLWLSWSVLAVILLNEKLELIPIPEVAIYIPAIALVILHLYNRNRCKCATGNCCANEE
ncbi:MerC domain-containing protein [Maribacter ulvicola]|uniref:MerC mercury resistance protein n=1 Tax=Maribacter ulvicola TaxID=228959 RepID=A0A1N6UEZ7_9FLAO|nr:MerC domain-containing protein [Maribacter ulvicola]SIQ64051.1 MerC mercury resistance protein [Maribacter ulvicola]